MKKIILVVIVSFFFIFSFQNENFLTLTNGKKVNANYFVSLKGKITRVNKEKIEFRGICTFDGKKNFGYDKPRYLDIEDIEGLERNIGSAEYKFITNLKAAYNINQNHNKYIIRSSTFLKIKSNKLTTFKAYLYTVYRNNEKQNVIIIYGSKE